MKKLTLFLVAILAVISGCEHRSSLITKRGPELSRQVKPEDAWGLYVQVSNPSEYLVLSKDGTFQLREVQESGEGRVSTTRSGLPWVRTLAGDWRIADGNTLILERIHTVALAQSAGFPPDDHLKLWGTIEMQKDGVVISGLRPPVYPGGPGESIWVKRVAEKK